jgi:biopolymer transport protein ExbB
MLLKIGRPHSEVEHAVAEASEREAERLYGSVRWLNLIAAVAPLTGLLGTVWGMIRAFYDTTHLAAGQNKAEFLAQGIYVALVTTLGGLAVAIPAAVCAHYFEGRVIKLFHEIDELLFNLMPQVERYEGRMRVTPHTLSGGDDALPGTSPDGSIEAAEPPRRGQAKAV